MKGKTVLLLICCLAYAAIGFHFSLRTALAGDLAAAFAGVDALRSSELVGKALAVCFLGYAATNFLVSPFIDALGMGLLMRLSGLLIVAGSSLAMAAGHVDGLGLYRTVWLGMLLVGIGWGLVDANTNPLAASLRPEAKTHALNVIHAWWPGGIILGGLAGLLLAAWDVGWRAKLAVGMAPAAVLAIACCLVRFPLTERAAAGVSFGEMVRELFRRPMYWVWFGCIWLTATAELAPAQWVDLALSRTTGMSGIWLLIYISGLMFVLRHFAGPLVHRFSSVGLLWISCLLASLGLLILGRAGGPAGALLGATLWGAGVCFLWPTMLATVNERYPRTGALGMGVMGTGATLAIYFFLPVMGKAFDAGKIREAGGEAAFQALQGADLERALAAGAAASFQVTAWLPMILLGVFGVVWLYERKRGLRIERITGTETETTRGAIGGKPPAPVGTVPLMLLLAAGLVSPASAQNTCPAPAVGDFAVSTVTAIPAGAEPLELAVAPDGRIFWIQIHGEVWRHDPVAKADKRLARLAVHSGQDTDDGLLGLALSPDFAATRWVYLYYAPKDGARRYHLSRFTVAGDTLAQEKILLTVSPVYSQLCHTAGSLAFGPDGSLYLATGDNSIPQQGGDGYSMTDERANRGFVDAQGTTANTNDLRGKILRILPRPFPDGETPAPGLGSTYTVPPGNLFPVGLEKTRPEIFTMGLRNPYRIAVDQATGWLFWGEVGPDAGLNSATRGSMGAEEYNLARTAGNFGWPYVIGSEPYQDWDFEGRRSRGAFRPDSLINDSPNNTGLVRLPPARNPLLHNFRDGRVFTSDGAATYPGPWGTMALGGPVYRYNPALKKAGKQPFPPFFDGHWIIADWTRDRLRSVGVTTQGKVGSVQFLTSQLFPQVMDMAFGPDGSLYALLWGGGAYRPNSTKTRIAKIAYTGTLDDACYKPPVALGPGPDPHLRRPIGPFETWLRVPEGAGHARLYGMDGRLLWEGAVRPGEALPHPASGRGRLSWVEFR